MKYQSKYYNVKTRTSDGLVFDSQKEARRWEELLLLQKAGKISDLQRQVTFELLPNQYETFERYSKRGLRLEDGTRLVERKVDYIADFVYRDEKGGLIVEDVKGMKLPEYKIKRKLMYAVHGIKITEI
jgi:hypothetical protein